MTNFNRTSWFKKLVMFMKYIIMAQIASCIILICKSWSLFIIQNIFRL